MFGECVVRVIFFVVCCRSCVMVGGCVVGGGVGLGRCV